MQNSAALPLAKNI